MLKNIALCLSDMIEKNAVEALEDYFQFLGRYPSGNPLVFNTVMIQVRTEVFLSFDCQWKT